MLRFDYRRTVLEQVTLFGPGLPDPLKGDRSKDAFDSFVLDSDAFSFLFEAPAGGWPAGEYAAMVDYRGAPPTLDPLGVLWRRRYPAPHLPPGRSTLVVEMPGLRAPRLRLLAANPGDPTATPMPLTPSQWPTRSADGKALFAHGPRDYLAPDEDDPSTLQGPIIVEIESPTPPGTLGIVRFDSTEKNFLQPLPPGPTPRGQSMADLAMTARRLARSKLPPRLATLRSTKIDDIRDAMDFWIGVEIATNPDHGMVPADTVENLRQYLWDRMLARCRCAAPPAALSRDDRDTLEQLYSAAIGIGVGELHRVLSDLARFELRFGLFATGQLAIYRWLGDEAEPYFQFHSAGVPDSAYFLLYGEAARFFGETDPRWLRLLPTLTWTAEIAMSLNWRGGARSPDSYSSEYARCAASEPAVEDRLRIMERARRTWLQATVDWPAEFDRVCRQTLAHCP